MTLLSLNPGCANINYRSKDVLSAFKQTTEKKITIQQGMSANEISEIVSEKIIGVVKERFKDTKSRFESE